MIFTVDTKYWSNIFFGPCILIIANRIILSSFFFRGKFILNLLPRHADATLRALLSLSSSSILFLCVYVMLQLVLWLCGIALLRLENTILQSIENIVQLSVFFTDQKTLTLSYTHTQIYCMSVPLFNVRLSTNGLDLMMESVKDFQNNYTTQGAASTATETLNSGFLVFCCCCFWIATVAKSHDNKKKLLAKIKIDFHVTIFHSSQWIVCCVLWLVRVA